MSTKITILKNNQILTRNSEILTIKKVDGTKVLSRSKKLFNGRVFYDQSKEIFDFSKPSYYTNKTFCQIYILTQDSTFRQIIDSLNTKNLNQFVFTQNQVLDFCKSYKACLQGALSKKTFFICLGRKDHFMISVVYGLNGLHANFFLLDYPGVWKSYHNHQVILKCKSI